MKKIISLLILPLFPFMLMVYRREHPESQVMDVARMVWADWKDAFRG